MERRRLLALMGGSATVGLAGCLGGDGGGGEDNGSDNNTSNDDGDLMAEANLSVSITASADSAAPGETTTVEWSVENTGDQSGSQTVSFSVDGSEQASEDVTVGGGETATGEFDYTVGEDDSGDLSLTVATDNDEASASVTVPAAGSFAVSLSGVSPVRVEAGSTATVPYQVENTGGLETTQTIVFTVDGSQEDSQEVTLGSGESTAGEFTYNTADDSEEAVPVTVASDDDQASVSIAFGVDVVSSFTATAESARAAIDNDPAAYSDTQGEPYQEIDTGEPLVELSGDIFGDGSWESTEFSVPDLIDILVSADVGDLLAGLIEDFDIQADLVEAFTLDELLLEIGDAIVQFNFSQDQAAAVSALFGVLAEEFELPAPSLLPGIVKDVLVRPELRNDYNGGEPAQVVADDIRGLLDTAGTFIDGVGVVETVGDLVAAVTAFIDDIPNGAIEQVLPFLAETIRGLDLATLLGDFSIEAQPEPVSGTADPSTDDGELLMVVPLETVTLVPDLGEEFSADPPEVSLDLGLDLTTGASGSIEGELTPDVENDTATATVVDNEFTADLTEFDLAGLVEGLDTATVLVEVFSLLDIELAERIPDTYDGVDDLADQLDLVSLVADGQPLGLIEGGLLQDESGRHAVVADLGLTFDDLSAVLD